MSRACGFFSCAWHAGMRVFAKYCATRADMRLLAVVLNVCVTMLSVSTYTSCSAVDFIFELVSNVVYSFSAGYYTCTYIFMRIHAHMYVYVRTRSC